MSKSLRLGALLTVIAMLGLVAACDCRGNDADSGGGDGSTNLLTTNSVIHVISSVVGIQQLHVIARPLDLPNMGGTCAYTGEMYEGLVPAVTIGDLDLTIPTTFAIRWTGTVDAVTDLGGFVPSGVGEINCLINVTIEGLGTGGAVIAAGASPNTVFAFYGTNDGPRDMPIDLN